MSGRPIAHTHLVVTAATHVGRERQVNEDRVVAGPWVLAPGCPVPTTIVCPPESPLVAVLDGMGGHAGGALAAATAAEAVAGRANEVDDPAAAATLAEAANRAVYDRMAQLPGLSGMGATIAALALVGDQALIMHVGDSRVYVESDRFLRPATTDHASPDGRLTRSLGGRERYEPVSADVVVEPVTGRRFLLATDGLFGHVAEDDLDRCLVDDDFASVEALIRLALEAGGPDNVTIALARVLAGTDGTADAVVEAT